MRFVEKDLNAIPDSLTNQACLDSLNQVVSGDKTQIKSDFYRGEKALNEFQEEEGKVVMTLRQLYNNKCAYCENREFSPEVEHYRPKKRVTRVRPKHGGYYWLCYEWTNLVPACHDCNKIGGGKADKFPIIEETKRLRLPNAAESVKANESPLIDEKPYLLHPEIDNPKLFFKFTETGQIMGIDQEGRGEKTIEICKLNRLNLLEARQKIIDEFLQPLKDALLRFYNLRQQNVDLARQQLINDFKMVFPRLENRDKPDETFTLMAWYVFENFEEIFLPLFTKNKHRTVVRNAYRRYQNGVL